MDFLDKFTNAYNDLIDFEEVQARSQAEDNIHALEVLRVHLDYLWSQVKRAYEDCRDFRPEEGEKTIDHQKLRESFRKALLAYKRALSAINGEIDAITPPPKTPVEKTERSSFDQTMIYNQPQLKLPPCDTDVFYGSYKTWPTFRDLFSAIYVQNTRLSKVEKLYHLNQKTGGEAREIISHIPLTHDGFDLAWKNLSDRYENKRMQVNDQLRTLFSLPSVSADSSSSLKSLQRTVNGCIQTLASLKVDTRTWDPILIFLCSTNMPRNYLEDFENTLQDSSKMPSWNDFDSFLTQRFKTLESVGNIRQSTSKSSHHGHENRNHKPRDRRVNFRPTSGKNHNRMDSNPDLPQAIDLQLSPSHLVNFVKKSILCEIVRHF